MTGSRTLSRGLDYLGDLGAKLRDLQGFRTLAHELIQNADDAKTATSIAFDITQDSLVVDNDGVFSDCRNIEAAECPWKADGIHNHRCDFHRFRKVAAGDKRAEEGTTGAFGIGFIAVYQITDAPELISGCRHWILQEAKPEDERILICDGCRKCVEADLPGTRFILPWAFDQQSILRQALQAEAVSSHAPDRMLNELRQCAPIAMLFLKRLREITVKQAGRIVKAWQRLDEGKSLLLTDGSPENDHVWHIINGQFATAAQRLRQAHPGRIEEKRSFNVTLAIPSTDLRAGLLCACLPTEHDVGLPFHVNADFFPTNDRKRIILEEDYQSEWNCAALRAGAAALSNAIDDMPRLLGGHRFWSFVSVLKQVAEKAEQDQRHSELREFWVQTAPHLRTASVVLTSQGKWVIADNASLLLQREESTAIALLESLGILIVHEDLRPFHTVLRADAGVPLLDIETITKALTKSGLTKRTQVNDLPAGLKPVTAREVLWGEIDLLLERQQRTPKTKAEDERRLHDVALAPGQDGALWPCREIYSADADTINLFHSIGLAIPFLDAENGFSRLKHLCPSFDARAAIKFLEGVNTGLIQQLWEKNQLPLPPLFEWFENRRQEILANPELKSRLGTLTLFPGAGKLRVLDRLSLPGDFVDPLALAELVDLEAVGGRREFLRDLGMPELSFTTYATSKLPAVLADQAIPAEKLRALTILLATHIGELKGNEVAQASLAATKIVECTDGVFRRAVECHFGTESVRVCLGDSAHVAVLPRGHEMRVRDFYAWLGVSDVPRISSIVARVRNFARLPYSKTNTKEIQNIVAYLGKNIEDPGEVPELNPLHLDKWLPARGRSDRWYAADELYAAYQDYLFESQSRFIDLPPNVQGTSRKLFEFLGIGITPTASLVVKHLLYCSVQQIPVNTQVYRFLNDEVEDIALGDLTGKKCLWLGDAYYSASEVFWGEHPFGRYRKQLGDELRIYSGLLKQLNVRETPTWEDAVSVLREISTKFGSQNSPLDEEAYAVLMACWRSIGEALDSGAAPIEAISDLRSVKCVPGPNHVLNPPEWMFFENRVGLAAKFGKFLANNVIARPLGTGRALDEAGVRGLGTAVQLDLLESVDPVDDPIMSERLSTRRNEMGRVLESSRSSCDTAAVLKRLENIRCQETASIKIRLGSLLEKFAGKIDLIYIDPPFATGADFSFTAPIGESGAEVFKEQSVIEEKAYRDTWGGGTATYVAMISERLRALRDLLSQKGTLYVHCDWHVNHLIRGVLDEVFGADGFVNEIAWHYFGFKRKTAQNFPRKHDTILVYANSDDHIWNVQYKPHRPEYVARFKRDKDGRLYRDDVNPTGGGARTIYLDEVPGDIVDSVWDDIPPVNPMGAERWDFPTQKPEGLLERIINASSNEGSLVADVFCGSGTTLAVAEKLNRRWIGCDLGRWAMHITRKRLLGIENCKPFEILNLGKYERQYWQGVTFGEKEKSITEQTLYEYLAFILKLYGAQPVAGMAQLHGKKSKAMIHIGAVDAPVTIAEIDAAVDECVKLKQGELHVLGWEWEMGLAGPNNDVRKPGPVQDLAKKKGVKLLLLQIPREVMEQQAAAKGDVHFFELAYLEAKVDKPKKLTAQVALKDFVISNTELIPEDVRSKVKKWSDYIDYWAVDWDFQNDTFMQGWVAYRTRKERKLPLTSDAHTYEKPGKYRILVKVIDIFGNDTSQAFDAEVK